MFVFAEDIEPEGDEEEDEKQPEVPSVRQSKYSIVGFIRNEMFISL